MLNLADQKKLPLILYNVILNGLEKVSMSNPGNNLQPEQIQPGKLKQGNK